MPETNRMSQFVDNNSKVPATLSKWQTLFTIPAASHRGPTRPTEKCVSLLDITTDLLCHYFIILNKLVNFYYISNLGQPVKESQLPHIPFFPYESNWHSERTNLRHGNCITDIFWNEWWQWRMASSGMLRRVALVRTDVSEELSTSFIRVTRIGELGTTLALPSHLM
jgi:hypothetical protein